MHKYIRVFYEKTNEANSRRAFVINLLNIISLLSLLIIIPQQSQAAAASSGITYTGRILDSSDQPVTASQVYFNITISDPDQKCWLYTEQRLVDMSSSAGNFSFEVGSNDPTTLYGTPSLNNPLGGGPATFADLFDNTKSFSNLAVGSYTSCTGTYDPSTATDKYSGRVMAIFFRIGAAGTDQALPALRITPVPMAMQAINSVKVNGYAASQLLKFGPTVNQTLGDLTQTNYDDLIDLITGASTKYLKSNTTFAGDVSGTASTMSVDKIKGKSVATPATSGDVLTYNGASLVWQAPVATGIANLNGITTASQSFASGTTPLTISSSSSTHTFNITNASSGSSGLVTQADWNTFNSKQSSSLANGSVWIGNASGGAQAQTLSGDATVSASGNVTVDKTQTAQASKILQLDSSGNAYVNGVDIKGSGAVAASIRYTGASNMVMNLPTTSGTANQFLQTDGAGNLSWASQSAMLPAISAGQVWVGNASGGAEAFSLSGDVASVSNTGLVTLTSSATGSNKLPLAGGTMSGAINMGGQNISNAGDVSLAAGKFLGLGAGSTDGTLAGQIWYDSGTIKYFDGTTAKSLGVAGAGITNINGLAAGTQSFAIGTAGNAPAFTSATSTHTLDIPMASASGSVTAGLISNADYVSFSGKQSNSLAAGEVWVGNASGVSEARALSGDIFSVSNSGLVTVNKTTTAQSNYILALDGSGVGNMAGVGLVNGGTVTLSASGTSATYSLKLPAVAPANNQILKSNATGDLSWVTYLAQVSDSAPLANGKIWVGNASGIAAEVAMSGDATIDNAGLLTLKNIGAVGTYFKVVTDAQGRVTSGAALASGDVTTALGFTPVNVAGDSMSGDLITQNISMVPNKYLGLSANSTDGTVAGQMWYDTGVIKYFDGTTVKSLGVAGAGITTLNGLSSVTQTFAVGTAGTDFAITSSGSGHTFDLPSASATNRGALTSADWSTFNAKQSNSLSAASVWVGNASGGAEARALSGDVTIDNVGLVTLKNTGSVGSYYKVVTDAQGRVVSGSTTLGATDLPALNDGTIWIGNSGNTAVGYAMSGDATMSNVGLLTLKNTGSVGTYSKVVTDAQGRVVSGSALASGDVTTALGFTPVNVAGDTMAGALNFGANDISNTGNISMAANKYFGLSANGTDGTVAGQMWYDAGVIKYYDGTTVKSLGVAGAGITTLNGLSSVTQSFIVGSAGNAPAITSSGSGHTFDFPMASASGSVTAGLISNADYVSFSGKQSTSLAAGEMWVGNASGVAQAFSLSGDVASVSNTGSVTVNKTTTGQSNYIMALDGSGVANAYGVGIKGATSGTVTLQAPASPANYSLTFPAAQGGANQVLSNDGSGILSWATALTGITNSAALTNGKLWIGNASGIAAEVNVSGDATMDNAGVMTLKNTGTVGTYFKVVTDAQGRVTSGAALASGDVTGALGYTPVNRAGDTMVGALITTAGTAAAPSLGIGQTTSGLFSGGTDILAFSTAGTERMRILANGRFGIGTTTPNSIIEINSGAPEIRLKNTAATAPGFLMTSNTGSTYVTSNVNYNYNLADSSKPGWIAGFSQTLDQYTIRRSPSGSYSESTYFTVSSTGNVGIGLGDTNASTKLQVNGGSILAGPKGTAAGDGGEVRFGELAVNGSNYVGFKAPDTLATDKIWTLPATDGTANQVLATNGSGVLSWATGSADNLGNHTATQNIILNGKWLSNDGGNQGVRVTNSGRVGIGLSTPSVLLELAPNGTNAPQMRLTNATDNSQISEIESGNFAVSGTAYKIKASGATNAFQLQTGISNGTSINYSTPGMVMTSTGEVGIGTSSPLSPLHFSSTNTATSGTLASFRVTPTYNQASGTASNTDLLINRTQTAVGSGAQNLIDAQVDGVSKFKVDNNGNITASGVNVGNYTLEKTFFVSFGSVANQKVDLVLGDEFWGGLEVSLASSYGGANATGQIRKVFAFGGNPGGTIYRNDSFYSLVSGSTSSYFAISNVTWDATLSAFKIQIVSRSSSNNYVSVNLRAIASESSTMAKIRNASIGSIYTTDSTTFPAPAVTVYGGNSASLNLTLDSTLSGTKGNVIIAPSGGNVGIGTSSPASTVHIASTVPSGLSFSNVDGLVIDNSGSSDSFYALQIGTATGKIFSVTNSGKVGIGTTSPAAKLDVAGEVKFGNTSSTCNSTNEGQQRYNSTSKNMEFCNGTSWTPYGTGRTSCPAGFTLIGTSGSAEAFCISTNEEATATWLNAVTACYNKQSGQIPRARLCTSSEWTMACVSGLPTAMTGNWEWVADLYSSTASVAGNTSCSSFNDDLVSASYKSRCCFH